MNNPFGDWLSGQIDELLLTHEAFAKAVGVQRATLYAWMNGENRPRGLNIVKLARALGVSRTEIESRLSEAGLARTG